MRRQDKGNKEKKKPKRVSAALRESQRALEANVYAEGFQHGYQMGLREGYNQAKKEEAFSD